MCRAGPRPPTKSAGCGSSSARTFSNRRHADGRGRVARAARPAMAGSPWSAGSSRSSTSAARRTHRQVRQPGRPHHRGGRGRPLQHLSRRAGPGDVRAVHAGANAVDHDLHRPPAGDERQTIGAVTAAIRAHDPLLKVTAPPLSSLVEATMGGSGSRPRSPPHSRCSRWSCPAPAFTRRSRSRSPSGDRSSRCDSRSARPGATSPGWWCGVRYGSRWRASWSASLLLTPHALHVGAAVRSGAFDVPVLAAGRR